MRYFLLFCIANARYTHSFSRIFPVILRQSIELVFVVQLLTARKHKLAYGIKSVWRDIHMYAAELSIGYILCRKSIHSFILRG